MSTVETVAAALRPRRVLDVATGAGDFALLLAQSLGSYEEIVAVDSQPRAVAQAAERLSKIRGGRALEADAAALPFPDGGFDLVSISNSLHHFPHPEAVLAEAFRVLAPGGQLMVFEMHREAGDETAMSHVLLHHWWARIDSLTGTFHAVTYDRTSLMGLVGALGLRDVGCDEILDGEGDPHDAELLAQIDGIIDRYLGKIPPDSPEAASCREEGEALRKRVHEKGFRSAPSLLIVGRKA
jgi:SAM-dependent methyltransferase